MAEVGIIKENTIRVKVHSRGYHDGSVYAYDVPSHQLMMNIVDSIDNALNNIDLDKTIECDEDDDECFDEAYKELGEEQDRIIDLMHDVLNEWDKKIQLPYLFWYVDACDDYDACYFDIYVADINDLMRWWANPSERDIIIDVLYTQYEFSIADADELVYFDPRTRTSIHTVLIPSHVFKPLWYRNDMNRAIEMMQKILFRVDFGIPDDPDEEEIHEDNISIA